MQFIPLGILFLLTIILFYYKTIYDAVRERLRIYHFLSKFEGPTALPLVGNLYLVNIFDISQLVDQVMLLAVHYCKQGCGMIRLWIGPVPMLAVITPEYAKEILESNEVITKADEYEILFPWLGTGLLTSTGDKWRQRRKMLTPAFHFKVLNSFLAVHDYQAKVFLDQIKCHADNGKEVDLGPYIKRMALDIICETSMGATVDAQNNHDHQSVRRLSEIAFLWIIYPWIKLKPIWYLSGYGGEWDRHLKIVTDFTKNVIEEKWDEYQKYQLGAEKKDERSMAFLDLLLQLRSEGLMNEEDIREEVDTFMFEGHDTTAASMGWTLWCMAHHPDVQEKVIEEVDRIFGSSDRDCTNDDLKQMKYLEKCLKESLRMFPSVPFFGRKVEKDTVINGSFLPKGVRIVIVPLVLQRNPLLFDNPHQYNPENFSEEKMSARHAYADVPFSAGPRNCIGQKFAMMEEKAVISWFFRRYRVTASQEFERNKILPELIVKSSMGFPLTVHHRMDNK
uniref:Cytochrome P450 n=1 Tax=Caenorhabditis tropicalis TaxID=1561998 RepID=A0A1I7UU41_9PELO